MEILAAVSCIAWLAVLVAPFRPWSTRERLHTRRGDTPVDLSDVTVIVPARNESAFINACLDGLVVNGARHVVVVDDESTRRRRVDGHHRQAGASSSHRRDGRGRLRETGRLERQVVAQQQGVRHVATADVLLLDADIELGPGVLAALKHKLASEHLTLVSVMAHLNMQTAWERLLMPAFVYFFKLLYPFALSNARFRRVAAAAGGCILLKSDVLTSGRGLERIRGTLIDDCALARLTKTHFGRTWIGLSHDVVSLRGFAGYAAIAAMVARTAYTQLRQSSMLLGLCTLTMLILFVVPIVGLGSGQTSVQWWSATALLAMSASYAPVLQFYERPLIQTLTLPMVAVLYLSMTWRSAVDHWSGRGAIWKTRAYQT